MLASGSDVIGWNIGALFGDRAFFNGDWLIVPAPPGWPLRQRCGGSGVSIPYPTRRRPIDASKHNYTITFPAGQLPPVNAFWSVTMYDGKSQLLIENPIKRYLINSPMLPGMKKNADGSLTLYVQKESRQGEGIQLAAGAE